MGLGSNKIERNQVQKGDHICTERMGGAYLHHGIVVELLNGIPMVIHKSNDSWWGALRVSDQKHTCDKCDDRRNAASSGFYKSCLDCFLQPGNSLYRVNYAMKKREGTCSRRKSDPAEVVVERAKTLCRNGDVWRYSTIGTNSEGFAIYCKTGVYLSWSRQVLPCSTQSRIGLAEFVLRCFRYVVYPEVQRWPGSGIKEASKLQGKQGSSSESRNGGGAGCQASAFGGIDMLVSPSLVANALGSLILAMMLLLGVSILCHPLWIVRWTQKLQPHILYLKPTQEKLVALTLDDGPHRHITPQLLDTLKENDCKATWFLIGKHMDNCPEVVERIHAEGHEVANHMMDDVASWYLSKDEFEAHLVECDKRLKNFFRHNSSGQPLKWFRPGHGFYNPQIVKTCNKYGYRVALGSLYPMDHMFEKQAKLLVKNLLWRIHPGAVIILHDRVPQWEQTPQVLRLLLPELKNRGYKVVTLSELEESVSNTKAELRPQGEELRSQDELRPEKGELQPRLSPLKRRIPASFEAGESRFLPLLSLLRTIFITEGKQKQN